MSIDPIEFGRVLGRLDSQDVQIKELKAALVIANANIDRLISLAERGKGGLWMLCGIGSVVSSVIGAVIGWSISYYTK